MGRGTSETEEVLKVPKSKLFHEGKKGLRKERGEASGNLKKGLT